MKKPQPRPALRQRRHNHGVVHRTVLSIIRFTDRFRTSRWEHEYQATLLLSDEQVLSE